MDKLYKKGLASLFLIIALAVVKKYNININFSHLDSTSFAVANIAKKKLPTILALKMHNGS